MSENQKALLHKLINDMEHNLLFNHYDIARTEQFLIDLKNERVEIEKGIKELREILGGEL